MSPKAKVSPTTYVDLRLRDRLTVAEAEAIIQVLGLAIPKDFVSGDGRRWTNRMLSARRKLRRAIERRKAQK